MKKIGIIIPYSFYPPMGGGALRCYYVVREMSKYHNLVLFISEQDNMSEFQTWVHSLKNVHYVLIPNSCNQKRPLFTKIKDRIKSSIHTHRFFEPANQFFLDGFDPIKNEIKKQQFDVFICENLEMLMLFNRLLKKNQIPIVYEAHNVDSDLWLQMYSKTANKEYLNYSKSALSSEKNLYKIADLVVTVTNDDKIRLTKLNGLNHVNIEVVESGVDTDLKYPVEKISGDVLKILFCGSLEYEPNYEGLVWFYKDILPVLRKSEFAFKVTIIGKIVNSDRYNFLNGVTEIDFIGTVDSVNKYYHEADVSIVPLLSGSGIRLKITEALSFGVPVISTRLGAEGIFENDSIIIADTPDEFVNALLHLHRLGVNKDHLGKKGREMVLKYYDWKSLMSRFNSHILKVINATF